jgi:hypothetical protein
MSKHAFRCILLAIAVSSATVRAGAPKDAPKGTTGVCVDGSYTSAAERQGACSGHDGVKEWYVFDKKAKRPKGTTGLCHDGTYTESKTKAGACSAHGGVLEWYRG